MKVILTCLVSILAMVVVNGQTPVQSYFEWTNLPFTKEELNTRRENLMTELAQLNKKGLVLIPAKDGFSFGETFRQTDDFYYFTGLELPNAILVLNLNNQKVTIYTPEQDIRFENSSRKNDFPGRPLLYDNSIINRTGIPLASIEDFTNLLNLENSNKSKILINNGRPGEVKFAPNDYIATYSPVQVLLEAIKKKHTDLSFENIYEAIAKVRMIKSENEVKFLKQAANITVKGIKEAAKAIKPGIDERYLEGVLEGDFKKNGSQRLAFGSIIKSGPNSHWPWRILATHYNRRNRIMQNGDLVIFDVGCEYEQYVSDIGRTFPVSGKFTKEQREILMMETKIADEIIKFLKPGITFKDVQKFTNTIIPEHSKKYMQVGLFFGHHLGLSTGDPNLSNALLKPGMVFTVEPWYYNHDNNISVFTEDMILITEDGCEVLSSDLPRTPEDLENLMKS